MYTVHDFMYMTLLFGTPSKLDLLSGPEEVMIEVSYCMAVIKYDFASVDACSNDKGVMYMTFFVCMSLQPSCIITRLLFLHFSCGLPRGVFLLRQITHSTADDPNSEADIVLKFHIMIEWEFSTALQRWVK